MLDFIGNYKKANIIPFLLSGKSYSKSELLNKQVLDFDYPKDCHIDLYNSFKSFYSKASNAVDMMKDKSTSSYIKWSVKEYVSLARRNPVHYLIKTHSEFFYINSDDNICINDFMKEYIDNRVFKEHFKDAIEFRVKQYYKNRFENKKKEKENDRI